MLSTKKREGPPSEAVRSGPDKAGKGTDSQENEWGVFFCPGVHLPFARGPISSYPDTETIESWIDELTPILKQRRTKLPSGSP